MQFTSLKQFPAEDLHVPGAQIIRSPVYGDIRGSLYESFHILKVRHTTSIDSIDGIYPGKKTVYGPVSHTGVELLYLVRGKLLVYLFDESDHSKQDKIEVEPGMVIRIPSNAIHVFRTLDDSTIFDIVRTEKGVQGKKYSLDEFNIELPEGYVQAPHAEQENPEVDYAILGVEDEMGAAFIKGIEKDGHKWIEVRSKLSQQEGLENELANIKPKVSFVIALGEKETGDKVMDNDQNVTGKLAAIRICKKLGIACTILTSDKTNALFEKLVKETGLDKHCTIQKL